MQVFETWEWQMGRAGGMSAVKFARRQRDWGVIMYVVIGGELPADSPSLGMLILSVFTFITFS